MVPAATRYALAFNGNVFVLKAITGHKTDAMLSRYVNITPELVAKMMHQETLGDDHVLERINYLAYLKLCLQTRNLPRRNMRLKASCKHERQIYATKHIFGDGDFA